MRRSNLQLQRESFTPLSRSQLQNIMGSFPPGCSEALCPVFGWCSLQLIRSRTIVSVVSNFWHTISQGALLSRCIRQSYSSTPGTNNTSNYADFSCGPPEGSSSMCIARFPPRGPFILFWNRRIENLILVRTVRSRIRRILPREQRVHPWHERVQWHPLVACGKHVTLERLHCKKNWAALLF